METIKYSKILDWGTILKRPSYDATGIEKKVRAILKDVRQNGDAAIRKYSMKYDHVELDNFLVKKEEFDLARKAILPALKQAIETATGNVRKFHKIQSVPQRIIETMPGVSCWQRPVAIQRVGLYVPGGGAPLFSSLLMMGIPARIAGCSEIVVCSPPGADGKLNPAILYVAETLELKKIYKIGGVQAIGAMAYGTESVPSVFKIFGPGNQFITCAKQLIQRDGISIDMPAGPSELAVFADKFADERFVASDLLSQAEHGRDSQVILVTDSAGLAKRTKIQIQIQLDKLPRKKIATKALRACKIIIVKNPDQALQILNLYAPEHLILNCRNAAELGRSVVNAGSVFLGGYSPESVGDYASGTNHTLPTNGFARSWSGLSVDSFLKKISFQRLSKSGLESLGASVIAMAEAEGLQGHAESVRLRLASL
ncbi:MAG TPA: histidinol dehydrogenase [Puia sp.]|nr:histidinol dehydrogenase [Puia sp.]